MRILTDRICCLSVTLLLASAAMAGCDSAVPQQSTKVTRSQPSPKPVNRSIERMLENAEGVLNINATLLVAYIGQIERHKIKELTLLDADQAALECLPCLKGLETLRLPLRHGGRNVPALPQWTDFAPVGRVTTLKSLTFRPRANSDLRALRMMKQLQNLELRDCSRLSDLGPLAELTNLTTLTMRHLKTACRLDPLAEMDHLTELTFYSCPGVQGLGPLAGRNELTSIKFHDCPNLSDLRPLAGLTSLETIEFMSCPKITDLGPLADVEALKSLEFNGCPGITDLRPLASLAGLSAISFEKHAPDLSPLADSSVESIELGWSTKLQGQASLKRVTSLTLRYDVEFDDLASIPNLKSVLIEGYGMAPRSMKALAGCETLESLEIRCPIKTDLAPLATLKNLRDLKLSYVQLPAAELRPLAKLKKLANLDLNWHNPLDNLQPLGSLRKLASLKLRVGGPELDLRALAELQDLRTLDLSVWGLCDLAPLTQLIDLQSLHLRISNSEKIRNLDALAKLPNLESLSLRLSQCAIDDLEPLRDADKLEGLLVWSCPNLTDLSPLAEIDSLKTVYLNSCHGVSDLELLSRNASLERVGLYGCSGVRDVSPLANIGSLKAIELGKCSNAENLSTLITLPNLESIGIPPTVTDNDLRQLVGASVAFGSKKGLALKAPLLSDLSPLASMTKLEELSLENCYPMDLSPLADLGLKKLVLRNCYPRRPESGNQSRTMLNEPQSDASRATDWDLTPLERLQSLKRLEIADCHFPINFEPIAQLKGLDTLWWTFHENEFEELLPITTLTHLRALALEGASNISEAEVARLRQMMPRTHVDGTEIVE